MFGTLPFTVSGAFRAFSKLGLFKKGRPCHKVDLAALSRYPLKVSGQEGWTEKGGDPWRKADAGPDLARAKSG